MGGILRELWGARHFARFIAIKTLQKIYRRTLLGWAWLFILPLFPFLLRTVLFGGLLNVPSHGRPYMLFLVAGSLCWDFFSSAVTWGTRGLQLHESTLKFVSVPRVVLPIASMAPAFLDLAIKSVLLVGFGILFEFLAPGRSLVWSTHVAWSPLAVLLAFLTALAVSLFTSVWGRRARDARFTMGQLTAVWFLLTPVLYPMSSVPAEWHGWMMLNPLAASVETFKWSVLGVGELPARALATSFAVVGVALIGGLALYGEIERRADDGE